MKIGDLKFKRHVLFSFMLLVFGAGVYGQNASMASSTASANCQTCVPTNWQRGPGTPDISNSTIAAATGTAGGGTSWTSTLPSSPNGHTHWISIRDVGTAGQEESLYTAMTNLVPGWEYEVTAYSLTALTNSSGGTYYSGKYIDKFEFQVGEQTIPVPGNAAARVLDPAHSGTQPRVAVTNVSQNVWGTNKLRFTATNSTMYVAFFPGNGAAATSTTQSVNFESVNISVSLNAINRIPQAQNKTATTGAGIPVMIDVMQGAQDPDIGQIIDPAKVDLNPSTVGIDLSVTTSQGIWSVSPSGIVTFTPAAGFYGVATLDYTVQDNFTLDTKLVPGVSTPKTISVTVNQILAVNDTYGPSTAGTAIATPVTDNDTRNGSPVVIGTNPGEVTVTSVNVPSELTFDPLTGLVSINNDAPNGTYTFDYTICENGATPANCETTTVSVEVENDLTATPDTYGPSTAGTAIATPVTDNDTRNGSPVVIGTNPGEVTVTSVNVPNELTFDPLTGLVSINNDAPNGRYTFDYTICENGATPANCETTTVSVEVANDLIATPDTYGPATAGTAITTPVTDNDTRNGSPVVIGTNPGEVTVTSVNVPSELTFDPLTGLVSINSDAPTGTYTFDYTICENGANPANCETTTVSVEVENAIIATPDTYGPSTAGTAIATPVTDNDTRNGSPVVIGTAPGEVTVTSVNVPSELTFDTSTGLVSINNDAPNGTYTFDYTICENGANPANCETATVSVEVENAIIATPDTYGPSTAGTAITTPVTSNDTRNGSPVVIGTNPGEVTVTSVNVPSELTFDPLTGLVSINNDAPTGTYTFDYTICENGANPANCKTETVTIVVKNELSIIEDDSFAPINGYVGGTTPSIFDNDTLNGQPVDPSKITLTPGTSPQAGIVMNPDGTVTVSPQTPAGTYEYPYTICENGASPANCKSGTVTLVIEPAEIDMNEEAFYALDGKIGGSTPSVLYNDTLNGNPVNPTEIILTPGTSPQAGIVMNPDGTITIDPQTPAGNYEYHYTICEILNPTNCADAVAILVVDAAPADVVIECSEELPVETAVFANSTCDAIQVTMNEERTDGDCINSYVLVRTWTGTDTCNNIRVVSQKITVQDTTAPIFVGILPENVTVTCNAVPVAEKLIAEDCSETTVVMNEVSNNGSCANSYEIVRTWTATDLCGNTSVHTQTIMVEDTTPPEFVGTLPAEEIFIRCEDLKPAEVLTATDICGIATVRSFDEKVDGNCEAKYDILRTWIATDSCGNETSYTQTIHMSCPMEVFNAVTPNGDGMNDELVLKGIECYPGNSVQIYNRWGVLVYETRNYNSNGNTFKGNSEGRVNIKGDSKLPTGTYYYVIKYTFDLGNGDKYPTEQSGYLHLENN